ncbi:hypothetical protein [Kribbella sp. NPDC023855]|uniref:hypothetical protein n=1 Tax=Kribbella sp. NPDC023855 TaxID=3154698 RepID=UPI0033E776EA
MFDRHRRRKVFEDAVRYAANGWPVAPLAVPHHGICLCGKGCVEPHLVGDVIRDGYQAAEVWSPPATGSAVGGLGVALVAEWFDVLELPPEYGALVNHRLKASCPTAMAPAKRQWWFFVSQGSVPREQVEAAGGVLRSGVADWVPAPGTWLEDTGRIRWLVHPYLTEWQPYRPLDPISQILPDYSQRNGDRRRQEIQPDSDPADRGAQ